MNTLQKIKDDQLAARKAKNTSEATLLTTLMAECVIVGKNQGRDSTEDEVISVVKKFLKNNNLFLKDIGSSKPDVKLQLEAEKAILQRYIPVTNYMPDEDLSAIVVDFIQSSPSSKKGEVMAHVKKNHGGQYDGSVLSSIVDKALSNV